MKKFKVDYTVYDCHEWRHQDYVEIIEAESEQEAKEEIESRSDMCSGDYHVKEIVEVYE